MADGNITKDAMYGAVAPDDFESMLQLDRYGAALDAFDKIIAATHDHFWDPLDKKYIDFDTPFDMENVAMTPEENNPILRLPYVAETLDRSEGAGALHQPRAAGQLLLDPARRAGRAEPVGQPLPRALGPGRAGIRRQPDPRGGAPRHRLRQVHQGALGPARSRAARR